MSGLCITHHAACPCREAQRDRERAAADALAEAIEAEREARADFDADAEGDYDGPLSFDDLLAALMRTGRALSDALAAYRAARSES